MLNAIENTTVDIIASRYIFTEIENKINNSKLACWLSFEKS